MGAFELAKNLELSFLKNEQLVKWVGTEDSTVNEYKWLLFMGCLGFMTERGLFWH